MEEETKIVDVPENIGMEQPEQSAEPTQRELAELEAYRRCFDELKAALDDIRDRFGDTGDVIPDPLKVMRDEIGEIRNGFAEMKSFFDDLKNSRNTPAQSLPYYPQTAAMPTPVMPFYQTPSFPPIIPALPTFNR